MIVGAGSEGCALAARLTEDPKVTVCLLKAGGADSSILIHAPAGVVAMVPAALHYASNGRISLRRGPRGI
ncbi:GMC family oxidoreductase N-terminal domain-containing protein [Bradyrhizobium sp. Tv2a-2]|uniref:GMC family oxidoreductase N-terminal domain-containing protein n=1 Tax=Bradyrhizobium sp. Tv2a-2 TaxID=113395 RepID=UPI00041AD663